MNLYLYIPPSSAHPPSCLKGLVMGEMRRYWLQNSPDDFQAIITKFINRLLNRGHNITSIAPLLIEATKVLDHWQITDQSIAPEINTLYLRWTHHPHGLQCKDIRRIFDNTLKPSLDCYNKIQIAVSRPKNLRDILTSAALQLPNNTWTYWTPRYRCLKLWLGQILVHKNHMSVF